MVGCDNQDVSMERMKDFRCKVTMLKITILSQKTHNQHVQRIVHSHQGFLTSFLLENVANTIVVDISKVALKFRGDLGRTGI